jgi:hypothetical protein
VLVFFPQAHWSAPPEVRARASVVRSASVNQIDVGRTARGHDAIGASKALAQAPKLKARRIGSMHANVSLETMNLLLVVVPLAERNRVLRGSQSNRLHPLPAMADCNGKTLPEELTLKPNPYPALGRRGRTEDARLPKLPRVDHHGRRARPFVAPQNPKPIDTANSHSHSRSGSRSHSRSRPRSRSRSLPLPPAACLSPRLSADLNTTVARVHRALSVWPSRSRSPAAEENWHRHRRANGQTVRGVGQPRWASPEAKPRKGSLSQIRAPEIARTAFSA